MLILSRRINETVIINSHVKVHVLAVQGQHIKLGFEAPKDVEIHRKEIFERIQKEKMAEDSQEK
jgi:carbon storage regulator